MADIDKIGEDVVTALRKAVSITGPIAGTDLDSITKARNDLQRSLHSYDVHTSRLLSSRPNPAEVNKEKKDTVEKEIKDRYPQSKGYTDKMYKMVFHKIIRKLNPFMTNKVKGTNENIDSSIRALVAFKTLSNIVLATADQLHTRAGGAANQVAKKDIQPDEFDPELSSTTDELDSELLSDPVTDKHQKQTALNTKRKLNRSEPTGTAGSPSEYRSLVAKYSQVVVDARTSVAKHHDALTDVLAVTDAQTFRLISNSARAMRDLAQEFATAATHSRASLVPGSYSACKAFADSLAEMIRVVIDSSARNKESQDMERKRNQSMDKYLKTTEKYNKTTD